MKQFSNNFKKLFLLHFTKELIRHSTEGEFLQLQTLVKQQSKGEEEELIRSIKINSPEKRAKRLEKDLDFNKIFKGMKSKLFLQKRTLTIPEPTLPSHLQYLKPVPSNIQINLEKLNPLIKDPAVKFIECNGPDEHIIVRGGMGTKPTNIVLGKEEIDKIIKTFSQLSRIPTHNGVYRVVVGRLILSSIISDVVGTKFTIKKIFYAPYFKGQTYPSPMMR